MKISCRVAAIRPPVKRLAASAAQRAVQAQSVRAVPSFRPLAEAEAEAIFNEKTITGCA
jgi:hypothetical protein